MMRLHPSNPRPETVFISVRIYREDQLKGQLKGYGSNGGPTWASLIRELVHTHFSFDDLPSADEADLKERIESAKEAEERAREERQQLSVQLFAIEQRKKKEALELMQEEARRHKEAGEVTRAMRDAGVYRDIMAEAMGDHR